MVSMVFLKYGDMCDFSAEAEWPIGHFACIDVTRLYDCYNFSAFLLLLQMRVPALAMMTTGSRLLT